MTSEKKVKLVCAVLDGVKIKTCKQNPFGGEKKPRCTKPSGRIFQLFLRSGKLHTIVESCLYHLPYYERGGAVGSDWRELK